MYFGRAINKIYKLDANLLNTYVTVDWKWHLKELAWAWGILHMDTKSVEHMGLRNYQTRVDLHTSAWWGAPQDLLILKYVCHFIYVALGVWLSQFIHFDYCCYAIL